MAENEIVRFDDFPIPFRRDNKGVLHPIYNRPDQVGPYDPSKNRVIEDNRIPGNSDNDGTHSSYGKSGNRSDRRD